MNIEELYAAYQRNPVICHDTRKITPGCLYWAIKGDRFDGNIFTAEALAKGAAGAVVDNPEYLLNAQCILADDSLKALQDLAHFHRRRLGLKVIAIAGSNGKTTTKELIKRVLSQRMNTFATPGNFNNHIGLPLSILQLTRAHQAAVLELGANHPGENAFLCNIADPDLGLITNIGKDHLEGFGGIEGVAKANLELFAYLKGHNGLAFVNMDDDRIRENVMGLKGISYAAYTDGADIRGEIADRFPALSVEISDRISQAEYTVNSNLFGSVNISNILAAAAVGNFFAIDPWQIKNAIESYIPENNRSQMVQQGSNTYILDAYNANPSSMLPAIRDFASYPADHKVLIIGDMYELGEDSPAEHQNILEVIEYAQFDAVAAAGENFYAFHDRYPVLFFKDTQALKEWYRAQQFENTVFYLKGSRAMALEKILDI